MSRAMGGQVWVELTGVCMYDNMYNGNDDSYSLLILYLLCVCIRQSPLVRHVEDGITIGGLALIYALCHSYG